MTRAILGCMYARPMYQTRLEKMNIDDILDRTANVLFLLSINICEYSALENAHTFLGVCTHKYIYIYIYPYSSPLARLL